MRYIIILLVLGFPLLSFAQTNYPSTDGQIWSEITVSRTIVNTLDEKGKNFERASVFLNGTLRFGDSAKKLIDSRIGFGLDYHVNKYLTLTPSYLYRSNKGTLVRQDYESRFRIAATLENKWHAVGLKFRNLADIVCETHMLIQFDIAESQRSIFRSTSIKKRFSARFSRMNFTMIFMRNFGREMKYRLESRESLINTILRIYITYAKTIGRDCPNQSTRSESA